MINIVFYISICWGFYTIYWLTFQKKKYFIVRNDSTLQDKIDFLQQNPIYKNNNQMIKHIIGSTHFIENSRRNNKPILIMNQIMCNLELTDIETCNIYNKTIVNSSEKEINCLNV